MSNPQCKYCRKRRHDKTGCRVIGAPKIAKTPDYLYKPKGRL